MRTLRNNPGFLVNFPSILNEVLASDMQKESFINQGAQPLVNILENEEQFEIEVLAPGFLKENFGLKVEENKLVISAELKEATEANEKNYSLRGIGWVSLLHCNLPDRPWNNVSQNIPL